MGAWVRRGLVWMIAGLLALAVIGAVYQAVATEMDQRAYPPPGEMVDIGGHRLHIDCKCAPPGVWATGRWWC